MSFWNKKKDFIDPIPLDKAIKDFPEQVQILPTEKPKDPEPDLSTKPKDIIGYCFGFVCSKKHVNNTFESITVDGYKERKVCQTCGAITKPATVKRTSEAMWVDTNVIDFWSGHSGPKYGWSQTGPNRYPWKETWWTKLELVRFLDSPKKTVRKK